MSIHGKNWNRKKTARLISKNKVRVVLASYRGRHDRVVKMDAALFLVCPHPV